MVAVVEFFPRVLEKNTSFVGVKRQCEIRYEIGVHECGIKRETMRWNLFPCQSSQRIRARVSPCVRVKDQS